MYKRILLSILLVFPLFMEGKENFLHNFNMDTIENKTLIVCEIITENTFPNFREIDNAMNNANIVFNEINVMNWSDYTYDAKARFRIAYSDNNKEIYIQYSVKEPDLKATYAIDSCSKPYTDSCCEFFVSINNNHEYYNLELNCIGIGTFAFHGKDSTTRYGEEVMNQIRRYPSLGNKALGTIKGKRGEYYEWQLIVAIPYNLYNIDALKGRSIKANFYKCGDGMPSRHYLSWNPIKTPKPNFHTPEYFGTLICK